MPIHIDEEVERAIEETVSKFGQSSEVTKRILAWLNQLVAGQMNASDELRQLDLVRKALDIKEI